MPEPVDYQIVLALRAALMAMSVAAGYYFDVQGLAVKLDPDTDVEELAASTAGRPFLILEVLPDEREYFPAMQVLVVLPVKVHWIGDAEPGDDESKLKTFLRACADIERAVGAEVQAGGFVGCNDARLVGRTYDTIGGSQMWAMVDVRFRFTRTFGTPESM